MTGDSQGNRYVARAVTISTSSVNVVVVKVDSNNQLVYRFQFPGTGNQRSNAIAVDSQGNVFVAGNVMGRDFPVIGSLIPSSVAYTSGFLSKLDPASSRLFFSEVFPGPSSVNAMALDRADTVYLTGYTGTAAFLVTPNAFQKSGPLGNSRGVPEYAFATKISNNGNSILYSTWWVSG